ncbi:dockerin type I domain-containing protein [Ruminococcus sp.]|uniref:dockerin type I domain-containing protein n=1 Tax=Ruminococcus sp. TaxID=41978 RepID=UPI0025FFCF15|nr:dockerin type I domain-containing protein [Ruminococcus sp.]
MSKKISSIIAITAMLSLSLNNLSFIPTVNAASLRTTYKIYGDLNGNNKIDIYDVLSMRKEVVKGTYNKTLDFNCDNSIDSADLTILNDYVLGKNAFFDAYLNDDADADDICDMFEIAIFETGA